jgi:hypothetical protein
MAVVDAKVGSTIPRVLTENVVVMWADIAQFDV